MAAELVGRDAEVTAMADLLAGERLVEIVGPGGIGKTALAIAVGRGWPSIEPRRSRRRLAGPARDRRSTADDVIDTVIAALDVPGGEAALFERLKGSRGRW